MVTDQERIIGSSQGERIGLLLVGRWGRNSPTVLQRREAGLEGDRSRLAWIGCDATPSECSYLLPDPAPLTGYAAKDAVGMRGRPVLRSELATEL